MQGIDASLVKERAFVDGRWVEAVSGRRFEVTNPASGERLGSVPDMGAEDARRAIEAAEGAWPRYRELHARERAGLLQRWRELVLDNQEPLARLLTLEMGKPLVEARAEIGYACLFLEWFAEEAKRIEGDLLVAPRVGQRLMVLKQPVGVCGMITPWNFPVAMITRKCAPALAAGCTLVLKPAEDTPLCALALAELADRAGYAPGVVNIVTASTGAEVGLELTTDPRVRKLSFTGSTATGRKLMAQAASSVKKLSLELGGNAPFIVFDDADLEAAVSGAVASKFRASGQTCICANRLFAQAGIHDAFVSALVATVGKLELGDGLGEGVQQGPLINDAAVAKVERLLADATAKGAEVAAGGRRSRLGGRWFEPTVLTGVTAAMDVFHEEIFGPVAAVVRFDDEADVLKAANDTRYGLAAYFYTRDLGRVWRVAEALECGMVGVNTGVISTELAPFGGIKESGIGREGSRYGIEDYLEKKFVLLDGLGLAARPPGP